MLPICNTFRVGLGFDVHRFSMKKKDLVLGGMKIPCPFGIEAVSDGDVVLHAISDAVCGACGLGDIGDYFPPQAKSSKGINSKEIVKFILDKIERKFKLINIDIIIVADKPKLVSHKGEIFESLKKIFSLSEINIKIKSKERLNILGGKESIACLVNVLVERQ